MVILQFNKMIRNKWVWGVFAIAISAFFCLDESLLRSGNEEEQVTGAGKLAGEEVDAKLFSTIADELRGFGRNRDWKTDQSEINLRAWENYAALQVAGKEGIDATDDEVKAMIRRDPSFQVNGAFSFQLYERLLKENSIRPEEFEQSLRRRITLMRIGQSVLGAAAWSSPMELEQAISDMTDVFTVKVARFSQSKQDSQAVKLDDDGLKKWYEENKAKLELPERVKIRYVKFDATSPEILAKMQVSEDDMKDRYDATIDRYTSTDTNGVETVKKFEDVKESIEKELRRLAAVQYFESNVIARVYAKKAANGGSRLDEIAKEDKLNVVTSDWFSLDGGYQEGFMKRAYQICPGANSFVERVAELDSSAEDYRYAVLTSERAAWLVEKAQVSPKHVPGFDEAKEPIRARALRDARAEAFKASVEAVVAKGAAAVAATGNVSTNIVFSVADIVPGTFPDQVQVSRAVSKLRKGEVSEFVLTAPGNALVVICEDRREGDVAKAAVLRSQIQNDLEFLQSRQIPESWKKWNLERLGFEPGAMSSIQKSTEVEE